VRRNILYWFVLTASPLLIGAIPLLSSLLDGARDTPGIGWVVTLVSTVWNVAVLWALLLIVYLVVPAARVRVQSAAIGAFVASVAIIALKGALAAYFEHAFGMSRLYGSLGLVPVFMFWMWVVWSAVLGGLEVSAFAQTIRVRGLDAGSGADHRAENAPELDECVFGVTHAHLHDLCRPRHLILGPALRAQFDNADDCARERAPECRQGHAEDICIRPNEAGHLAQRALHVHRRADTQRNGTRRCRVAPVLQVNFERAVALTPLAGRDRAVHDHLQSLLDGKPRGDAQIHKSPVERRYADVDVLQPHLHGLRPAGQGNVH
jgi:hypothetical protein